jgi:predicted AAA+ superfamily ATPase
VHRLIEKKNIQFILTGSSARKLKRSGVNLLARRAITKYMYPLTALELGAKYDFSKSLLSGLLPSAYLGADTKQYLSRSHLKSA